MPFNPTEQTLALTREALKHGQPLRKGVTIASGLTYYDLLKPAKDLFPVITPLRNVIPRVGRANAGDAAHWRQVSAITGSGFDAMGWVPEGQRSGTMSYTTAAKTMPYMTLGEEDYITFEAEAAAQGLDDENSKVTVRLLEKLMRKEEMALLGGNASLALGTPATPVLSATGTGATLPALTYSVIVVALTFEGYKNASLSGGIATVKTITGADGKTFTLNGGSSNKSLNVTQAVTLGQTLSASVSAVQGAVAYAWFVGAVGSETLQAITSLNSVVFSAPLTGGRQAASGVTADCSSNPGYAFDGLLTQALNPANSAYVNLLPTGAAGAGSTLTASGRGSVMEIDAMLQAMWDSYRISPTVLYVNSQELRNITNKILSGGTSSLMRYDAPGAVGQPYQFMAGGTVEFYFNPFACDGGVKMPIKVHPDLPPGTLIAYAESLPSWYQTNETPNVAEVLTRRDYYRMDWPARTRAREYGIYAEEALAVYATFAMGVIGNIGNG
jgi:hypothetical protein